MENYLGRKEKASFYTAIAGQNIVYAMATTFLMTFYIVVLRIDEVAVGVMFIIARIWDAGIDPIMGGIIDKTKTRWGKMRPFLLFTPVPLAVITIICFIPFNFGAVGNIVFMYISYILWCTINTMTDVPLWGMTSVVTPNTEERSKLINSSRIFAAIGGAFPILLVAVLAMLFKEASDYKPNTYLISAIITAVLGGAMVFFMFFGTKERFEPDSDKEKFNLKEYARLFIKNKPLLLVSATSLLGALRIMVQALGTFIAIFIFGGEDQFLLLMVFLSLGLGLTLILLPKVRKRFNYKQIHIAAALFGAVVQTAMFFSGYQNKIVVYIYLFLVGVPFGVNSVVPYALVADSVDYLEHKCGVRAEGLCFAVNSFLQQLSAGIVSLISAIGLKYFLLSDTPKLYDNNGLYFLATIIPAISCILSIIPMLFYDFVGEKQKKVLAELNARRGL